MRWALPLALGLVGCASAPGIDEGGVELDLIFEETFDDESSLASFRFTDRAAWAWNSEGSLELLGPSDYEPPHRSPLSIALLSSPVVADFVLEADLLQSGREYGHRDLCLFFGHQDASRFYYVHLASIPDVHAHNVFLVNEAPRTALAGVPDGGVQWGEGRWHHVRIERAGDRISVFFDREAQPIHTVMDGTLRSGRIGFGSFDDKGRFDNIRIWSADPAEAERASSGPR